MISIRKLLSCNYFQASASGHVRCVKCLLEHGADTKLENHFNQTAVVLAAAHGHNDIVQSLVAVMSPSDGYVCFMTAQ